MDELVSIRDASVKEKVAPTSEHAEDYSFSSGESLPVICQEDMISSHSCEEQAIVSQEHLDYEVGQKQSESQKTVDDDAEKKVKMLGGHYAGLPQEKEPDMEVEEGPNVVKTERDVLKRMKSAFKKHINPKFPELVGGKIVHASYCKGNSCPEEKICKIVKSMIEHRKDCIKVRCDTCNILNYGRLCHAIGCDQDQCEVNGCHEWKDLVKSMANRGVKGEIIYSTTPLFKEGSFVEEDIDFTFLHKIPLGQGGCGLVSRVWFYHISKQVEADIIVKEVKKDPTNEAAIHRIIRHDHPNLLGAMAIMKTEFMKCSDIYGFLLMERAECTLYDLKKAHFKKYNYGLPLRDCRYFLYQIANGLSFLHLKGIIHKDIKDKNLLVFKGGERLKIADWDLAIHLQEEKTKELPPAGTKGFVAPEVLGGRSHGTEVDIYSAAVTFLEIRFGGMYPKTKEGKGEHKARLCQALERLKSEDKNLWTLIKRCLSDQPEERPTARELLHSCLAQEKSYKPNHATPALDCQWQQANIRSIVTTEPSDEHMRHLISSVGNQNQIERMLEQLPKVLPNENIPQSNDWVGQMQPTEEEGMDIG